MRLVAVVVLILIIAGVFRDYLIPDRWLATVYPDAPSLLVHVHLDEYDTLDECRFAARDYLMELGIADGLFECGLNCEPFGSDGDMMLCEETTE